MMSTSTLLDGLRAVLGASAVLTPDPAQPGALDAYLIDWRQRYQGQALAVVRPGNTAEVAATVSLCAAHGVAIVPQGGNTSLVGGSIPDESGQQIVLSLVRLNKVLGVDAANLSMTVQAGCLLADVQAAADEAGLLFPLSLAAEGSCTIGGNLATNAGGTQVLRYGTARELCLGLEVVTAQGEVWDGQTALRKNNMGYDLRDLLIGSEGTLGVITAATLRLYPRPRGHATALLACNNLADAVALLQSAGQALDADLTAFEVMARLPLELVQRHIPDAATAWAGQLTESPSATPPAWTVLLECHSHASSEHAQSRLATWLTEARSGPAGHSPFQQALLASHEAQRQSMWLLRESIPLAEKAEGLMVKHDIGLPTSGIPAFVHHTEQAILARWPLAKIVCFGHLGDGNLHYNVQPPPDMARGDALKRFELAVNEVVFDAVSRGQGSISAEHGIGQLRREELARRQSPVALHMMQALKKALDPAGLMNPGRVLI